MIKSLNVFPVNLRLLQMEKKYSPESYQLFQQKKMRKMILLFLFLYVLCAGTTSISSLGTTLPMLSSSMNYRVFNDLMKQSLPLVPYNISWGSIGRYWGGSLSFINGQMHQYPSSLLPNVFAVGQIKFYPEDSILEGKTFQVAFKGIGKIGIFQQIGTVKTNVTWSDSKGGSFQLSSVAQSLFVYIYQTSIVDPVNSISIFSADLGPNPPTFTSNFLKYIQPFNMLRTCFWQGQNIYNSNKNLQVWGDRPLLSSSTQLFNGVALQHILELENYGVTIWPCIPDSADTNYITQMGTLFANTRTKSNTLYLQFGNIYTPSNINDFPDAKTTPAFSTFLQAYGNSYRSNIIFTINYKDIQYYINAMGMRKTPIDFTYIDAIGAQAAFGPIDATDDYGQTDDDLKNWILHKQLSYQTTLNKAYQISKRNGTDFVTFSGGPYLKTPRYGWNFLYSRNTNNITLQSLAAKETNLYNRLANMIQNDPWTQELYLHWIARLKSIGIKTLMVSELIGSYIMDTDRVPILSNFTVATQIFNALKDYSSSNRLTSLPIAGVVPSNTFVCNPACLWGDCVNNACICYAGYSGSDCSSYTPPNTQNKIGMNLQGVTYWTTQHPFIDMHRQGSSWVYFVINQGWSSGDAFKSQVPLDSNGYPTYLPPGITVGTLIARDVLTHYDNGTYVVLYDGEGTLSFGMFDVLKVKYGVGRVQVVVQPSTNGNNGLLVSIERTNPNNPVRNIRVIRPGFEGIWQSINFSPLLLEKLQPFGTLRFMDWTNTNSQTDVQWQNRTSLTKRTYVENGVAWEETIRLCNTLGKHAWINIPHRASDNYVTKLAQLFYDKLEPHLDVYIQYSNQVWGTQFQGGQYAQNQGVLLNLSSTDPTQARFCYLGLRTNQISAIWKKIFGTSSNRAKIVVSTQAVNADTTKRILACQNTQDYIYGVAIAPYLSVSLTETMSLDNVISKMTAELSNLSIKIKSHLNYTVPYKLPLLCYQSGQGLLGATTAQTNLQISVQSYDKMRQFYLSYLEMLFNSSITLANHYTDSVHYTQYGSWGLFQYADQKLEKSQKWLGTKDYLLEQNLPISPLTYGSCSGNCSGNGLCVFGKCQCYSDYNGTKCQNSKFIDFMDCGYLCTFNQGVCNLVSLVDNTRYFSCSCLTGYTGVYCGIPICTSHCSYNGKCTAPNTCQCFRGRMGSSCEIDCGCGGHGKCNSDKTCQCDQGFFFNSTSKKCQFSCNGLSSDKCYGPNLSACSSCISGTCNNGICVCWPGFSGSDCATETNVTYPNSNLGLNVGGLSYWSTQHLFKNFFLQSSDWCTQYYPNYFNGSIQYTWNTSQTFPTRSDGYPSSLYANMSLGKLLLRDIQGKYPNITQTNKYVLLYDGDGIIDLGFDAAITEQSAGRIKFTVTPSTVRDNGVYVKLIETNPSNPLKNIRVVLEGDEYNFSKDILTENFMKFISQFSTIRFMDLQHTNASPLSQWSQNIPDDFHTQATPKGISIGLIAKIIQRSGRNAWINIPHLASDDYITKFATFLKANIPLNRIIYVEYSNEVWNTFFEQGKYATTQASNLGLANYHKFYAKRSAEIFNIFSTVFGTDSLRLKFVVSFQAVSKWVADQILSTTVTFNGSSTPLSAVASVIASAPYYDCNSIGNLVNTANVTVQDASYIIQVCSSQFSSLTSILQTATNISASYGNIPLATYEAGTSISEQQTIYSGSQTPGATANFIAANRDAGMFDIYKTLLKTYKQNGLLSNAPTMLFSSVGLPSKYGSWGLLDYMDQVNEIDTHPKFKAILYFNDPSNPQ